MMTKEVKADHSMSQQSKMVRGMAWLTAGDFISRLLGAIYIIPWYAWFGVYRDQANALFFMGYTVYGVFLMISTVGINTAVAKQIAKYNALGEPDKGFYLVNRFLKLMLLVGLFFAASMYILSPALSIMAGAKDDLIPVMRSLSLAVLFFPMMSVLRGVFQGHNNLQTFAVSQLVEQVLRIVWMLASTYYIMKLGSGNYIEAVTQSTLAAFVGMLGSLSVLLFNLMRTGLLPKILHVKPQEIQKGTSSSLLIETAKEAIPFVIVGSTIQLYQLIDMNSFVNVMAIFTSQTREELLTLYSYMVSNPSKITMLLIGITGSIGSVAIPLITENVIKGDKESTAKLILHNLQMFMIFLMPAIVGAILLSRPLYSFFYGQASAIELSLFNVNLLQVFLLGLHSLLSPIILALFEKREAIYYFVYGLAAKLLLHIPCIWLFGAYGPILSTTVGLLVSNYLMYKRIHEITRFNRRIVRKNFLLVSVMTAIMALIVGIVALGSAYLLPNMGRIGFILQLLIAGGVGVLVYGILSLITRQADQLIGAAKSENLRQKLRIR